MHGDVDSTGDGVLETNAVEEDVENANKDLPNAVDAEEVAKAVEVLALEGLWKLDSLLGAAQLMQFQK